MSRRWVSVTGAGMAVLLSAGCHRGGGPRAAPTTSSPSTVAPTILGTAPAPASSTTAAVGPTTATTRLRAAASCPTSALAVSLSASRAAAGTAYQDLVFTNISRQACTLQGYPGVSFIDGQGAQIGAPATPMSGTGTGALIAVAPGGTAVAPLAYHDAYVATFPDCQPTAAAAIRVYPPDQTSPVTVPSKLAVCANPQATGTASIAPVAGR